MTHAAVPGHEATADPHVQRGRAGAGTGEDLLGQAVRPGKAHQPFHTAQRGFLVGALGDGNAVAGDARQDGVKCGVIVELPSQRGDILSGTALQQEAAFVVVEAKPHDVGQRVVVVHADRVLAEAAPVGELLGLDDDVARGARCRRR